ncbi:MAG: 50S ribosomal protein L16 [Saprospiraceae bacterium]
MLQPKRQKYRKQQKGRNRGIATKGSLLSFGSFGLKSMELGRITNRQLEAARIAMTREIKREGQVWIRIFPDKPITHKPAEVRMGKGKGAVEYFVALVQPGRILFEMEGTTLEAATKALNMAAQKLPIKTKIVVRHDL